jgi:hypothetical protein
MAGTAMPAAAYSVRPDDFKKTLRSMINLSPMVK